MKKNLITLLTSSIIAAVVFYVSKDKTDVGNYGMLVAAVAIIFSVPLMKFLFPVTKELKIGTSEFYPNLFHKTVDYFKRKATTDNALPISGFCLIIRSKAAIKDSFSLIYTQSGSVLFFITLL